MFKFAAVRRWIALGAIVAATVPTASWAETWLCIADQATGFRFNSTTKRWESANFQVADSRYVVNATTESGSAWEVKKFGAAEQAFPEAWCKEDFNDAGFLHCAGLGGRFVFNGKTGRFQSYFQGSYVAYNPTSGDASLKADGGDTPYVEIGRCSKI